MASYKLKSVPFCGTEHPVVLQNENGPCPLIAAANVLILRGRLKVPPKAPDISQDRLMSLVAEHLLDTNLSVDESSRYAADLRQNLQDVISVLPKMATGVDVNPKFDSIRGFEFTNEVAIFDLMNISLVHGWLYDPQDERQVEVLSNQSYNQVVSQLVAVMGKHTPKHLLTPQNSMASLAGSAKGTATSAATPAGSEAAQGEGSASGGADQACGSALDDLINFDDDAMLLPGLPAVAGDPGECGAEKVDEGDGCAENAVEDMVQSLLSVVAEGSLPEAGQGSACIETSTVSAMVKEASPEARAASESKHLSQKAAASESATEVADLPAIGREGAGNPLGPAPEALSAEQPKSEQELAEEARNTRFVRVAQEFLEATSSQLTVHGLHQLMEGLNDNELAVLFRNNHFNTMYKRGRSLYILVTDQGYLREEGVVWERLDDVDGDTQYVTHDFLPFTKSEAVIQATDEEMDLQRALAESVGASPRTTSPRDGQQESPPAIPPTSADADYALALQLHEEMLAESERGQAPAQPPSQPQQQAMGHPATGVQYAFPPISPRQQALSNQVGQAPAPAQAFGYPTANPPPQGLPQVRPQMAGRPQAPQQQQVDSSNFQKMWHSLKGMFKRPG